MAKTMSERLRALAISVECDTYTHDEVALLREAAAEIDRLNSAIQYEQHRSGRIGTHGPGCEAWGPAHYECAIRAMSDLARRVEGAAVGRVDMLCARDAVVVDEIDPGRLCALNKQRVALLPLDAADGAEGWTDV